MRIRILLAVATVLSFAGIAFMLTRPQPHSHEPPPPTHVADSATTQARRVPAFQEGPQPGTLPPTLPAAQFIGKTREAYRVAKQIPTTLAQLPCYCECDRGFGHKSLHSCFVDNHASQCAVCVDEALMAYRLQQEEKLTPDQVRARIIEKYSTE